MPARAHEDQICVDAIRRRRDRSGKEQWLLVHKRDQYAVSGWDPGDCPRSVLSGRSLDEVQAGPRRLWRSDLPPAQAAIPVNDRMRAMDHERLEILTGADGTLLAAAEVPPSGRERLTQTDTQLPKLLRRHRLLHNAIHLIYAGAAVLVLSVIAIAIAVTAGSGAPGATALALVLAGTVMLLGGLLSAARSIIISTDAIGYEVQRTLSLGS